MNVLFVVPSEPAFPISCATRHLFSSAVVRHHELTVPLWFVHEPCRLRDIHLRCRFRLNKDRGASHRPTSAAGASAQALFGSRALMPLALIPVR